MSTPPQLAIVTATLDVPRMVSCLDSWTAHAQTPLAIYVVGQGGEREMPWDTSVCRNGETAHFYGTRDIVGVVPAFAIGVQKALEHGHAIIACLHDDLEIREHAWDQTVMRLFKACPRAGLCGFGGAKGLADEDIYQTPYDPHQLARKGFRSNMQDAEAHGMRSLVAEPVACLDGFSQIGLREFWEGSPLLAARHSPNLESLRKLDTLLEDQPQNLFAQMQSWGVTHHFYDGMLGCFAKRLGYQVWYLPIACHHYGGRTAVGDARYQEWANTQPIARDSRGHLAGGDAGFWLKAHQVGYDEFRDVLPIRV